MCWGHRERLGHHGGDGDIPGSVATGREHGEGGEVGGCALGISWLSKRSRPRARAMGCAPWWHPGPQSHTRALQCGGRGHTTKPSAAPHLRSPASAVHLVLCLCLITQVQWPLPEIGDSKMMLFWGQAVAMGFPTAWGRQKSCKRRNRMPEPPAWHKSSSLLSRVTTTPCRRAQVNTSNLF